jgi:alpha-glucosidase
MLSLIIFTGISSLVAANDSFASNEMSLGSPNRAVQLKVSLNDGHLTYAVISKSQPVIETSPMHFTMDGKDLSEGIALGSMAPYEVHEVYPWRGGHSQATNHCNGATISIKHGQSGIVYTLEMRAYDDGVAFRYIVPGQDLPRVPDEATTFILPPQSVVWYHDLEGHYEGVHVKKDIGEIKSGEWLAPPVTFKLPGGAGYGSITEAAVTNYSGMALQADGRRGLVLRLGHTHPPSYPFRLRYGAEEAKRLSTPASITGTITTAWRVVLIGSDLNTLLHSDIVHNLCPPPDKKLFPEGLQTPWIQPGRSVWKFLDGGASTLEEMKEFSRLAGELGFEYNVIEGFWQKWSPEQLRELVVYSAKHHVKIWLWKHRRQIQDPVERRSFFKLCQDVGVAGVKLDFFDHEAKEVIDLYEAALKDAASFRLMVNFHGASKPTGESRTWPNEMTREGIYGLEHKKMAEWSRHNTTLPFTRMLAGPGDYTPVHFGERRKETSLTHQVASAAVMTSPLLTYGAHPKTLLESPALEMIKSIPSVWDETIALPVCEIGEIAALARRRGDTWFIAILNGPTARAVQIRLPFLAPCKYRALMLRDQLDNAAGIRKETGVLARDNVLTVEVRAGGGFIGRLTPSPN